MLPRVKNSRWDTRAAQKAIRAPRGFSVPVPFWWVGETPPRSVLHPLLLPGKVPALQLSTLAHTQEAAGSPAQVASWRILRASCADLENSIGPLLKDLFEILPQFIWLPHHLLCHPRPVLEVLWHCSTSAKFQAFALSYCVSSIYFSSKLSCLSNATFLRSPHSNSSLEV